ncbi:palmitoyltransferase for Vac8p [Cryptotrichosporon argae]
MTPDKRRPLHQRIALLLPVLISYGLLGITYIAFITFISLEQVLVLRHNVPLFISQFVIYHALLGMTVLSYVKACTTRPHRPDPSLAPDLPGPQPQLQPQPSTPQTAELPHGPVTITNPYAGPSSRANLPADPEDIPLRYLRNAQWVSTRTTKSRPSPLPLRTHSHAHAHSYAPSLPSPYSPFQPQTPAAAGQDASDVWASDTLARAAEGRSHTASVEDIAGRGGRPRRDGRKAGPIMAKDSTGAARYCRKCDGWKPDRAHHCSVCRQCVLKMDHHCPWLNNCVGYHNHKAFLLFVTYGSLLALYTFTQAGYETYRWFTSPDSYAGSSSADNIKTTYGPEAMVAVMLTFIALVLALAVGGLAVFHWHLAASNKTTLEDMSHTYPTALLDVSTPTPGASTPSRSPAWTPASHLSRRKRTRFRAAARAINVYDLGAARNLLLVLVGDGGGGLESEAGSAVWTWRKMLRAAWPLANVTTMERGNGFEYDRGALHELRRLTRQLRVAEQADARGDAELGAVVDDDGYEAESDGGSDGYDQDSEGDGRDGLCVDGEASDVEDGQSGEVGDGDDAVETDYLFRPPRM